MPHTTDGVFAEGLEGDQRELFPRTGPGEADLPAHQQEARVTGAR